MTCSALGWQDHIFVFKGPPWLQHEEWNRGVEDAQEKHPASCCYYPSKDGAGEKCKWVHRLGGGKWRELLSDRAGHLQTAREGSRVRSHYGEQGNQAAPRPPAEVETGVAVAPSRMIAPGCGRGQGGQLSSSRVLTLPVRCTRRAVEQRSESGHSDGPPGARWVEREVRTGDSCWKGGSRGVGAMETSVRLQKWESLEWVQLWSE